MTASSEPTTDPQPITTGRLDIQPRPLSTLVSIGLYLFAIFFVGALLAPRLHTSVQFAAEPHFRLRPLGPFYEYPRSWLELLARQPFDRFLTRVLLFIALLGLPHFFKSLHIKSAGELGLRGGARHFGETLQGLAWGFAALALMAAMTMIFHARAFELDHSAAEWLKHIRSALIAAFLAGTVEEILYRGAIFGTLRREKTFWQAAVISSLIYAVMHFFERPPELAEVHWYSGFVVLGQMLRGFTELQMFLPAFLNLFLLGILLCLAVERTGSVLFSMGLHGGFIFWIRLFGFPTHAVPGARLWIFGSGKFVDGWSTGMLLVLLLLVFKQVLPERKRHE
jgi:membrane protease YdiL (CAAX protease family)